MLGLLGLQLGVAKAAVGSEDVSGSTTDDTVSDVLGLGLVVVVTVTRLFV
jgi:hypothetical protein